MALRTGDLRGSRKGIAWASAATAAIAAFVMLTSFASASTMRATLATPHVYPPAKSPSAWTLPVFAWGSVGGADHYEFELAADTQFDSPVLEYAGHFTTYSTRATVMQTVPNGRYWWRVRAVSKSGGVSGWAVSTVTKNWNEVPALLSPGNGRTITYPTDPLVLSWRAVAGAASYRVELATDSKLAHLVGGNRLDTTTPSITPPAALASGTYYWRVTALDADGQQGQPSRVNSFHWSWPTGTAPKWQDLVADSPDYFSDPQLSWNPVKGAASYELDVNFDSSFAPGSRVCCSKTTIATSYSPQKLLDNNTYYWRVRAIDVNGNQGQWKEGEAFKKTFDNLGGSSIPNLHLRDNNGDLPSGATTSSPVLAWKPVTGASSYEVSVAPFAGGSCNWSRRYDGATSATYWSPAAPYRGKPPYPAAGVKIVTDGDLSNGTYCARVRAVGDAGSKGRVYGDYSYLQPAFAFPGYPFGGGSGYDLRARDDRGQCTTSSPCEIAPLLTWQPIAGARSYWVLVSRDQSFTTLVDYAHVREPAFAPRESYADETTSYYWAVIPASGSDGSGAFTGDPNSTPGRASFNKVSLPPALLSPKAGETIGEVRGEQPVFRWTPVVGARMYHLQVSSDSTFASGILDDVTTDSTGYASTTTYPPGKRLYWRVQAIDENKIALTWSPAPRAQQRFFQWQLPRPQPLKAAASGGQLPTFRWKPTPGAVSYDLHVVLPNGSTSDFTRIPTPAWNPTRIRGLGLIRWSVRGEFPKGGYGTTPGPYSRAVAFTRTLQPPSGEHASAVAGGLVLSWKARVGAAGYEIQISRTPDFARPLERSAVAGTSYAPLLRGYPKSGHVYWRVACVDSDRNVGSFSRGMVAAVPPHAGSSR